MRNVPLTIIAIWLVQGSLMTARSLDRAQADVRVRVYGLRRLPVEPGDPTFVVADSILTKAGVVPHWVVCGAPRPGGPEFPCSTPVEVGELVVRLVSSGPTPSDRTFSPLGDALVDTNQKQGTLATIYVNAVESLAQAAGLSRSMLLGRVLAHEIGHLLLGTSEHTSLGIMRAAWTRDEVVRDRPGDWRFSPADASRIKSALLARRERAFGATGESTEPRERTIEGPHVEVERDGSVRRAHD